MIVAVGGGGTIDIAKMIAAFWYLKGRDFCTQDILMCIQTKEYVDNEIWYRTWFCMCINLSRSL